MICVVGLGYVGLPLAIAFAKAGEEVIGFDVNQNRINTLKQSIDYTNELSGEELKSAAIQYTDNPEDISKANFIIVAVPTPITDSKVPDLKYMRSASEVVGKHMSKGSIVVYESTVYPGVTEDVCRPILEKASGMNCGTDFKIGYSPERINPGDKEHTVDKIIKVVSGMDSESTNKIAEVYSRVVKAGIFKAASIKTAEAAKVIENVQRDLNIALMNELSIIFDTMDIEITAVLEAAGTKWNFHKYHPGLVGGHCIGVDPYYLTHRAKELGYHPQIILAGRNINDNMHKFYAEKIIKKLIKCGRKILGAKVLVMGMTFKPNVADYRNSRVKHLIEELKAYGVEVLGCDPLIGDDIVKKEFGIKNYKFEEAFSAADFAVITALHDCFKEVVDKIPEERLFLIK